MSFSSFAFLFFACVIWFTSCKEEVNVPRPRGYLRIELPVTRFNSFDPASCPFKFDIPDYAIPVEDTNALAEPCWWYLVMPKFNAQLYLTYKPVKGDFAKYLEDTHTLVYKHTSRASSIDEQVVAFRPGVGGVLYTLGGEAASATQFFVTDSVNHFLRGALYFNTAPNADSLAPVQEHIRNDVLTMLKSLEWK
ncbi:MAG: gliding motility lipoprotein GldD [Bacteroidota bacterium]